MFKIINRMYSRLYYKSLVYIWDKFSNSKHWQIIKFIFNILMMKDIWYDKINNVSMEKIVTCNPDKIKNDLLNINMKMNSRFLGTREIRYKISFVIQNKIILESNTVEKSYDVDKKILFVKISNQNFPIEYAKKLREGLTLSVFHYLNLMTETKSRYNKFSDLHEINEKVLLEIETVNELELVHRFLKKYFKEYKIKNKKYTKRKFGAAETVLNIQHIWSKEMSYNELLFLINKLHRVKHDHKTENLTLEDLIS